jgi:ribonuclease VapC
MIAVDTSALMAIALSESEADACIKILESEVDVLISAGTVAEALIVAAHRDVGEEMRRLIDEFGFTIVDVTPNAARRVAAAYERFGDCFSYEIAKEYACRLLFIGNDFSKTDLKSALGSV